MTSNNPITSSKSSSSSTNTSTRKAPVIPRPVPPHPSLLAAYPPPFPMPPGMQMPPFPGVGPPFPLPPGMQMPPPAGAHAVSMKMTKNANHRSQFQAQLQTQAQSQHKKAVGVSYNKRLKLMKNNNNNNNHHDMGRRKSVDDAYDGENDHDREMDVENSGSNSALTRGKDASKSTIGAYARMVRKGDRGAGGEDDGKPAFQSQNNKAVAQKIGDQQSSSRGLRHFSEKVAKKVQEKGHTTYQEVADELVYEYVVQNQPETLDNGAINFKKVEHKNIRRRVYDALNVLMAMDIISKKNKDIFWRGLPDSQDREDLKQLKKEKSNRTLELDRKRSMLLQLLKQQVLYRNLVKRNRQRQDKVGSETLVPSSNENFDEKSSIQKISIPFCLISTSTKHKVEIEIGTDQRDASLSFSDPFQIHDDKQLLELNKLGKATREDVQSMFPDDLLKYCEAKNMLKDIIESEAT